ncbi:hypothetical protein CPLU01_13092 [Colletotrichum plurivorum]|uniref:F-box domain-containing protein n=1 Tax=Colletotrichum plurivorum TaxID=2175906 RepID=A0A8H6N4G6_9PEZI|nr:hypothetical protein CPLU01_13092 [Colletotrichum plurivorum]
MTSSWMYECPVDIDTLIPSQVRVQKAKFPDGRPPPPLDTMRNVHDVLSNCSTIRSLKLRLSGRSYLSDRFSLPFDLSGVSTYPSKLEVLHLEGYHFDDSEWQKVQLPKSPLPYGWWPNAMIDGLDNCLRWYRFGGASKYFQWRGLPEKQQNKTNLDLWIDAMDFSQIRDLGLQRIQGVDLVIGRLIPHLTSVKSLTIRGHTAPDFIAALPQHSLEHLSWITDCHCDVSKSTLDIVGHHAKSLISLERREPEHSCPQRHVMTAEELGTLGDTVPNLQRLAVDLNRDGSWPMEELGAIAEHFPKLTVLELYLELNSDRQRQIELSEMLRLPAWAPFLPDCSDYHHSYKTALPLLTKASATELFRMLHQKKVGEELMEVKFFVGDWERLFDGGLYGPMQLPIRRMNAWISCKIDPDGVTDGPEIRVICEGIDVDGRRVDAPPCVDEEEEKLLKLHQEMNLYPYHNLGCGTECTLYST